MILGVIARDLCGEFWLRASYGSLVSGFRIYGLGLVLTCGIQKLQDPQYRPQKAVKKDPETTHMSSLCTAWLPGARNPYLANMEQNCREKSLRLLCFLYCKPWRVSAAKPGTEHSAKGLSLSPPSSRHPKIWALYNAYPRCTRSTHLLLSRGAVARPESPHPADGSLPWTR